MLVVGVSGLWCSSAVPCIRSFLRVTLTLNAYSCIGPNTCVLRFLILMASASKVKTAILVFRQWLAAGLELKNGKKTEATHVPCDGAFLSDALLSSMPCGRSAARAPSPMAGVGQRWAGYPSYTALPTPALAPHSAHPQIPQDLMCRTGLGQVLHGQSNIGQASPRTTIQCMCKPQEAVQTYRNQTKHQPIQRRPCVTAHV